MKSLGVVILPRVIAGSAFSQNQASQAPAPAPVPPSTQGQFFVPAPKPLPQFAPLPLNLKLANPYSASVAPGSGTRRAVPLLEMKAPEGVDTIAKIVPHPELIDPIAAGSPIPSCGAVAPAPFLPALCH